MNVRARRLENEWTLLAQLAEYNRGILEVVRRETLPDAEVFHVILHRTSVLALGEPPRLMEAASHAVAFRYPPFYPSIPIEAFLAVPVFHPNVHPENGFVCLWDRFSAGDTIIDAVRKLQLVITWELWNDRAEHMMQPEALARPTLATLGSEAVRIPEELKLERMSIRRPEGRRRRLR
jgi:hypothetical protein